MTGMPGLDAVAAAAVDAAEEPVGVLRVGRSTAAGPFSLSAAMMFLSNHWRRVYLASMWARTFAGSAAEGFGCAAGSQVAYQALAAALLPKIFFMCWSEKSLMPTPMHRAPKSRLRTTPVT